VTDMFIPKRERIMIALEAVFYVILVLLTSYFTVCGDLFIRMVPMIYFLGLFGVILFNKPVVSVILTCISTVVFGYIVEQGMNMAIILFSIYSCFMIICGEITGHILNIFHENYRLRKFIKYYTKITYIVVLLLVIVIPLVLNNIVNSNFITYINAKKAIDKYVAENYAYSSYRIEDIKYINSKYEFSSIIDGIKVTLNYSLDGYVEDVNLEKRKALLNRVANAELNILLKEKELVSLDVESTYDYSRLATIPDIINLNVCNVTSGTVNDAVLFIEYIKEWDKYELVSRINVVVDNVNVSITKKDLEEKNITEEYILNGMKYEMLDSKEGIKYE